MDAHFSILNQGTRDLVVSKVTPGCGCTSASISKTVIPPGGTAEITAQLSLKFQKGPLKKEITIESNDQATPKFVVYIAGTAVAPIDITPEKVMFGAVALHDSVERTIELSASTPDKAFKILSIESGNPELMSTTVDELDAGMRYRVHVVLAKSIAPGTFKSFIRIKTDNKRFDLFGIAVTAQIVGDLAFDPSELELGEGRESDVSLTRYIVISAKKGKSFRITGIQCPNAEMKAEVLNERVDACRIRISNIRPTMALNGSTIVLKTDLASLPEVRIPIKVQAEGHPTSSTQPTSPNRVRK